MTDDAPDFGRLVATAWAMLEAYPASVFTGASGDPGAVFVARLREALEALEGTRWHPNN